MGIDWSCIAAWGLMHEDRSAHGDLNLTHVSIFILYCPFVKIDYTILYKGSSKSFHSFLNI